MTIAARRAIPHRSWWSRAIAILTMCVFIFDRNLGATVVVAVLAYRFVIDRLPLSSDAASCSAGVMDGKSSLAPDPWHSGFPDVELHADSAGGWINPATGLLIDEHSGLDSAGCPYGQSNAIATCHRW